MTLILYKQIMSDNLTNNQIDKVITIENTLKMENPRNADSLINQNINILNKQDNQSNLNLKIQSENNGDSNRQKGIQLAILNPNEENIHINQYENVTS